MISASTETISEKTEVSKKRANKGAFNLAIKKRNKRYGF